MTSPAQNGSERGSLVPVAQYAFQAHSGFRS